jgi:hypothetical protein
MRGLLPSTGVAKFALFVPPPSWASALTGSLPSPPLPKLFAWKLPAALGEAVSVQLVVDHVVQ